MPSYNPDPMGVKATQLRQHRERLEREAKAQTRALHDMQRTLKRQADQTTPDYGGYSGYSGGSDQSAQQLEALRYYDEALQRAKSGDMDGAVRAIEFSAELSGNQDIRDMRDAFKEWARTGNYADVDRFLERLKAQRATEAARRAEAATIEKRRQGRATAKGILIAEAAISSIVVAMMFHNLLIGAAVFVGLCVLARMSRATLIAASTLLTLFWAILAIAAWFHPGTWLIAILVVLIVVLPLGATPISIYQGLFN